MNIDARFCLHRKGILILTIFGIVMMGITVSVNDTKQNEMHLFLFLAASRTFLTFERS
jgi:hypothetical protein